MQTLTRTSTRLATRRQRLGVGLQAVSLQGQAALLDPFIGVEHFRMSQPTFPPHPHAGFSAVSYLFDDAETALWTRDSSGHAGVIAPGDLHWMQAGSGLMHEELPLQAGRVAHGLQLFVNLPAAAKLQAPCQFGLRAGEMPRLSGAGWRATLVFGDWAGAVAPLDLPMQAALAVLDLEAGAAFELPLARKERGFVLVVGGRIEADGETWVAGEALAHGTALPLQALEASRLAVFTGRPLREPLVQHGPFAMNTEAQLVDALRRYQQGDMGRLPPLSARP